MSIVLSGYYGFSNAGDEAILQATVSGIRERLPGAKITILSADPDATTSLTGAPSVNRYSPGQLWRAMRPGGLLVSGGGGLFQDVTSRRSLLYYLGILRLARLRGMKTLVYAQGLGPLNQPSSRSAVRRVLQRVDRITFRDEASATLLAEIGLPNRAVVTADPAFALAPAPAPRAAEILSSEGVPPGSRLLAVAVRSWTEFPARQQEALAGALRLAAHDGVHVLFVSMHYPEDLEAARALSARLDRPCTVLQHRYQPAELAAILGAAEAVVAMRLHAIILAAISGVPTVALSYDPKVDAVAQRLGLPTPIDVRQLDLEGLDRAIHMALGAPPAEQTRIREAAEAQKTLASENFRMMEELLSNQPH